mgnify:CR=1 FL=1
MRVPSNSALTLCAALLACAPGGLLKSQQDESSGLFPPTSQDFQVLWQELQERSAEKDWKSVTEGLETWIGLLDKPSINLVVSNDAGVSLGVRKALERFRHLLPTQWRQRLGKRVDAVLKGRWSLYSEDTEAILTDRSRALLRHRILRDFPESKIADVVLREEIGYRILQGDWPAASRWSRRLLRPGAGGITGLSPQEKARGLISALQADLALADATAFSRHQEQLKEILAANPAEARAPQLETAIAGLLKISPASIGQPSRTPGPTLSPFLDPVSYSRGIRSPQESFRPGGVLWRQQSSEEDFQRFVGERRTARDGADQGGIDIPIPYHPTLASGMALLQHERQLTALDLSSGKPRWQAALGPRTTGYLQPGAPVSNRETCFAVHGNTLQALALETGELVWRREFIYEPETQELTLSTGALREAGGDDKKAARGIAPAAGTPHRGGLILPINVRAEKQILCYLVRIDGEGELLWKTYLGSKDNADFLGLGSTPSPPLVIEQNVLYLANHGFISSVDAEDGTIAWIKEYDTLSPSGLKESIRDENRWHPNALIPAGNGDVIAAPQDSTRLLSIRASDGTTSWSCSREEHSSLIGRNHTACFLAGSRVSAVGLSDAVRGKTLWSFELDPSIHPQGRGLLVGGRILLSSRRSLLQLSALDGKLLSRDLWDFPEAGGNMLLAENRLVVIHPGGFVAYSDLRSDLDRLEKKEKRDSRDLLELARLRLRSGDLEAGIDTLESWTATKPSPPPANSELDRIQLATAETLEQLAREAEPGRAEELLKIRTRVENNPARKVSANIGLGLFLKKNGKSKGSLAAFHDALSFDVERPATDKSRLPGIPGNKSVYRVDGFLQIPAEEFIRSEIRSLRKSVPKPGEVFQETESKAAVQLRAARKSGEIYGLQEIIRLYPFTEAAAAAYKKLAISYLDRGNSIRAARTLLGYVDDYPLRFDTVRTALRAAQMFYGAGKRAKTRALYEELLATHPDKRVEPIPGMDASDTVGSYIRRRLADPGLVELRPGDNQLLHTPLRMTWRSPADLLSPEKIFLEPEGERPESCKNSFFTQASEILECRDVSTGIPSWTINLSMIPGYIIDPIQYRNFRFARSGDKELRGVFAGKLLILHDHRNLFAVDHQQGKVRWSIPLGGNTKKLPRAEQPVFRQLSERIRGCLVTADRVYVSSSHRQLYCFGHDGAELWRKELKFNPAQARPALAGDEVFVLNQRDLGYGALAAKDGAQRKSFHLPLAYDSSRRVGDPVQLGNGLCLLPLTSAVLLLDLAHRTVLWGFEPSEGTIEQIAHSAEAPDEVIAVLARDGGTPALAGLSIENGRREWIYEKFGKEPSYFSIFRDGRQLFVIHGSDRLKLLALEVRRIPGTRGMNVSSLWPQKEIHLGTYLGRMRSRHLHILENAIIFPDPGQTISIYDRVKGTLLRAVEPNPLSSFLTEKRSYRSAVASGHLVLLTDGGGCGMTGAAFPDQPNAARKRMGLLSVYLKDRTEPKAVIDLALAYFQAGDYPSAVTLLDRTLQSEALLSSDNTKGREDIAYLLEGIKQEAMKHTQPREITARQLQLPPVIDGRLEDSWSYAHRVLLTAPRNLNLIPAPGLSRQWEGEEDLSAILYTGWDKSYFYFALDVEDDILRAYDRDAENWKGDCLLIGLDPDGDGGYRQGSDDQLMTLGLTIPKRRKEAKEQDGAEGEQEGGLDEENEEEEDNEPQGLFSVKKKPDSSGAIYEVALPWTSFPLFKNGSPPPVGFNFGLSLLLTDDDTGRGATKTLSINPCHLIPRKQRNVWIWRFMIPEFFPRVRLR